MADNIPRYAKKLLPEIIVRFKGIIPPSKSVQITCSKQAVYAFRKLIPRKAIEYKEYFYVLCLSRSNTVIGYFLHSLGGLAGTTVDIKQILAVAVKTNAASILICHNHPSGNRAPSRADRAITTKIVRGASLLDITMLDHLILTKDGYYSFADEGTMPIKDAHNAQKVEEYISSL